jgi:integrase
MSGFPGHPLFDAAGHIEFMDNDLSDYPSVKAFLDQIDLPTDLVHRDYEASRRFLVSYDQVPGTFGRYRTEVQRFLNYLWLVSRRTLNQVDGETLQSYLNFVETPPAAWISRNVTPAFSNESGHRQPQAPWRPFSYRVERDENGETKTLTYRVAPATLKAIRGSLRLYFAHLMDLGILDKDPFSSIRRSTRSRVHAIKTSDPTVTTSANPRRLTGSEWDELLATVTRAANENPSRHERTLFVIVTMKALYLRVSELSARIDSNGMHREPSFGDFKKRHHKDMEYWVFTIYGKGGKLREVTLSDAYLPYLKRWRNFLGLNTMLPVPGEQTPILPSSHGGNLKARAVATIYENAMLMVISNKKALLATAVKQDERESLQEEVERFKSIKSETHYLRHTGASQAIEANEDDLRHISEELGHASRSFTEQEYLNSDQFKRRQSGRERKV